MRPGKIPNVGIGSLEEVEGAIHRCQLPGIPLAAWLIDELRVREDITGTMYNHALGMPHDWHFALIAIDD